MFDAIGSHTLQHFIKLNSPGYGNNVYHLKGNDRIETPFRKFVQMNQNTLARCIRNCWMEPEVNQHLPPGRLLVVGGPDSTATKLQYGQTPEPDYILESKHTETYTRMLLHTNLVSVDQYQNKVIISTTE